MHEVIEHIVDRGSFLELQTSFAHNAIIGLARMGGQSVGIVARNPRDGRRDRYRRRR